MMNNNGISKPKQGSPRRDVVIKDLRVREKVVGCPHDSESECPGYVQHRAEPSTKYTAGHLWHGYAR
jgi:hypothetical protein